MSGFTGVVWEARTPQRLAADLHAGPGERPLTAAAGDWRAIAAELTSMADAVDALLAGLGQAWTSGAAGTVAERISGVGGWLRAQAARAEETSVSAHAHAIAVTVARAAMPHPAETDAAVMVRDKVLGHDPVGTLTGAIGAVDWLIEQQRLAASRVMASYEAASQSVCLAHHPALPPPALPAAIAEAGAAGAEGARAGSDTTTAGSAPMAGTASVLPVAIAPRPKTAYVHRDLIPDMSGQAVATEPGAASEMSHTDGDRTQNDPARMTPTPHPEHLRPEHLPPAAPFASPAATGPTAAGLSAAVAEKVAMRIPATADQPTTWAQVAAADTAVADHATSAYATERLRLRVAEDRS